MMICVGGYHLLLLFLLNQRSPQNTVLCYPCRVETVNVEVSVAFVKKFVLAGIYSTCSANILLVQFQLRFAEYNSSPELFFNRSV